MWIPVYVCMYVHEYSTLRAQKKNIEDTVAGVS